MAAAYAALVSLTHIVEQITEFHAHRPFFLDEQRRQLESLQEKVSFLLDFLEVYSSEGYNTAKEGLESRIAEVAYAAEDIIESHVVDRILLQAPVKQWKEIKEFITSHGEGSSDLFSHGLQSVIESIDAIQKDVVAVKEISRVEDQKEKEEFTSHGERNSSLFSHGMQKIREILLEKITNILKIFQQIIDSIKNKVMAAKERTRVEDQKDGNQVHVVLSRRPTMGKDIKVEYYEKDLVQIMDKLTGQSFNLQIIPIVGMGGIGKTTLARHIFENQLTVECFLFRAWVTVSQEYNLVEILLGLLHQIGSSTDKQESCEYHELGERLHKHLSGRKYLIIIDDMWSADVWEKLKLYLPNYNNGSRVIITTRLLHVVDGSDPSYLCKMKLLDENKSWSLLCTKVFGHDGNCPLELEEIGKDIARNCKGLPLSIVVIGGLLAKSKMTQEYWWYVAKHIHQIVNSEDDGRWLNILYLSYNQLPMHLKPCFLYMGSFKEDRKIRISALIKVWVAEGFLKPCKGKSLEEAAVDYLKDLIDRNLVFVHEWGSIGKMKTCGIHDLLRDLCLKEAQKDRLFRVVKKHAQSVDNERRIIFHEGEWDYEMTKITDFAKYAEPYIRSLSCNFKLSGLSWEKVHNLRLIRVLSTQKVNTLESTLQLVNLRYLKSAFHSGYSRHLPPMMCQLWYLQTLILTGDDPFFAPYEIWEMPQLRHIIVNPCIKISDTLHGGMNGQDGCVLRNLQTIKMASNLKFTEEVIARIPNIKKLSFVLELWSIPNGLSLHNLDRLHNLQSLTCSNMWKTDFLEYLALPHSLKKLTLMYCEFDWDSLTTKIGSLPNLEKLKLEHCDAGAEWNTVEGKFLNLKFLQIDEWALSHLVCWTSESSHFPLLQHLDLSGMDRLKEIPSCIGDTLQLITLAGCGRSVIASAKEIVEEQESNGNEDLRLTITEFRDYQKIQTWRHRAKGKNEWMSEATWSSTLFI